MDDQVNILAVDDNPDKLLALEAVLSELGPRVVTATSGREALRALLTNEFAVVLLDVNMPGMDGFETAALLRQRKNSEHTPIIFVTSYGDETHATRGYRLGAVDYILAPVDPEVLKTKVAVFVELFRKNLQVRQQARTLEQKAVQLQRLTEASLAINSALSPAEMLRVVTDLARDILGAHQAVAVATGDPKGSAVETAVSLSTRYEERGERAVLADQASLNAFLSQVSRTVRIPRGGQTERAPWTSLLASDRPGRLGWIAAPLSMREGRPIGLLHLLDKRDGDFTDEDEAILTQLAQMTSIAIENILNAEAREANRVKDEFLTTLSHELRTPLSAILGWTRTLRDGFGDPGRVRHGLEVIERNVRAQTKLIDDLLDVSRIITGKLRLNVRSVAVAPIIEAAIESMRPAADAKDIGIDFERGGSDAALVADPDRLQQVVWNLVSNSIKFTPRGGRVRVALEAGDSGIEVCVSDTGRGIRREFLPRVFERFRQADSTTTRTHGGLGIGLAIARHLVELHGGTIVAESDGPNRGARFTVSLPSIAIESPAAVALPETGRPEAPSLAGSSQRLDGVRILLVEDEPDSRELLEHVLSIAGANVDAAASVPEALGILGVGETPDVIVSDIGMPGQDGYDLIRHVRGLPPGSGGGVPALALTAYAREEDRLRALAAGFDLHVPKPVDPADLVASIAGLLRPAERPASSGASSPRNGDEPPIVRILVVEDDVDSREGLKNLLEMWGHSVDVAEDGAQGVERAIRDRPGVALIDIGLPEIDGYEVATRIREALGADGIYLVALTGHAGQEERERALANGFDAHISKPIDFSRLSTLLASRAGTALVSRPGS